MLLAHFVGQRASNAETAEIVWSLGLKLLNLFQVVRGHFLDGRQIILAAVHAFGLQRIEGVVCSKITRQIAEQEYVAARAVDAIKRRLTSPRLNGDQG